MAKPKETNWPAAMRRMRKALGRIRALLEHAEELTDVCDALITTIDALGNAPRKTAPRKTAARKSTARRTARTTTPLKQAA